MNKINIGKYCHCAYYSYDAPLAIEETTERRLFLRGAIDSLHKEISLYHYDVVIMPDLRTSDLQYMMKYIYRFNQPRLLQVNDIINSAKDIGLYESVCNKNILVVDDITTSDSTLNELLRTLRIHNKENEISIFSLNSRKDFLVDKNLESLKKEFVKEVMAEQSYDALKEWLDMHEEARFAASVTSNEPELIKFKKDYIDSIKKGLAESRK